MNAGCASATARTRARRAGFGTGAHGGRDRPRFGGGKPRHDRGGRPHRSGGGGGDGPVILFGWHSVTTALSNPARKVRKLLLTENAARRLTEDGFKIPAHEIVRPDEIARKLTPDSVHNGLLAEADPLAAPDIEDLEAEWHRAGARPDHRSA